MTALADRAASASVFWPLGIFSLCAALANPAKLVEPLPNVSCVD